MQDWLLRLLENRYVGQAAARAAYSQDARCVAPLTSTNPVAPPSLARAHASVPTVAAHPQDHSVAVNQAAAAVTSTVHGIPVEAPSDTAAEAAPAGAAAAEAGNKEDLNDAQAQAPLSDSDALLAGNKQSLSDVQAHAQSSDSAAPSSAQQAGSKAPSKPTVEPAAAELKQAADTEAHAADRTPAAAHASAEEEPVGVAPSCEADQPALAKAPKKRKKSQSQPINNVFGSVSRNRKRAKAKKQKTDSLAAAAAAGAAAAIGGASSAHGPLGTEDRSESTIPNSSAAASNDTDMASAEAEVGSPDRSRHPQRPANGAAHDKPSQSLDPATTHMNVSSDSHMANRANGQHSAGAAEKTHVDAVAQRSRHAAAVAQPSQQPQDHAQQQAIPSAAGAQAQQQRTRIPTTAGAKAAMHTAAAAASGGEQRSVDSQQQGSGSDRANAMPGSLPDGDQPMGDDAGQGGNAPGPAGFEPEHDSDDEVCA